MSTDPVVFPFNNLSGYILWVKFSNAKSSGSAKEGLSCIQINTHLQISVQLGQDKLIYATIFYQNHPSGPLEPVLHDFTFCKTNDSVFMDQNMSFKYKDCKVPDKFTSLESVNVENKSNVRVWAIVDSRADHLASFAEEVIKSEKWKKKIVFAKLGFAKIEKGKSHRFTPFGYDSNVSIAFFDEDNDDFKFRGVFGPHTRNGINII